MNIDAVFVLQRSDVAHLVEHAERFAHTRMLFVDPGLMDEAVVRGVKHYELRRLEAGPDFHARAFAEALSRATLLDLRLTQERERLWPGASLHGWDVGVFYLGLLRATVARQLGALVERSFPERRIGLLRPSLPQQMYFDAFVCPDLVARDPERFVVIDSYEQVRWHKAEAYAEVFDAAALRAAMAGGATAVTHVPTCFYDRPWLAAQVAAVHPRALDLPSPLWDVPLQREGAVLRPLAEAPADEAASAYRQVAASVIETELQDLLPLALPRTRQVQAWAQRCHWQALNYTALRQGLAGTQPQFLLSDQDTGHNGPLFSVADELGAPITVVPHSGHPSMLLPHARRVTAVEHAGYGTPARTVLGQAVATRAVRYKAAPQRPAGGPGRVRTVCLLLNSLQTEGLSYVDVFALAAFYRPLAALCQAAGVSLVVRAKPGAPSLSVLAAALGVAPQQLVADLQLTLEHLAAQAQLCIAYGEPTTGVAPFLASGSLVLQVNEQRWPGDYVVCMPLVRDGVIPLLDNAAALSSVSALLRDPEHFESQRRSQSAAFDARARLAHDTLFDHAPLARPAHSAYVPLGTNGTNGTNGTSAASAPHATHAQPAEA